MILMGLLSDILLLPVTGPIRGLHFIFEQIREQVDEEQLSESGQIQDELMSLASRYELGELSEQTYAEQETALLERLNELRSDQEYWQETEETESEVNEPPISSETGEDTDEP
jgi:hypothetical protein